MQQLFEKLSQCKEPFSAPSIGVLTCLTAAFGDHVAKLLVHGLTRLAERFPSLRLANGCRLIGPCVDGVGCYPETDLNLRATGLPRCFVAGDANGRFRGIVAALLSGHYAGATVCSELFPYADASHVPSKL